MKRRIPLLYIGIFLLLLYGSFSKAAEEKEPQISASAFFLAKQERVDEQTIAFVWEVPEQAYYYVIYGAECGSKNQYKRITAVKTASYIQKSLKKGTYYKFIVAAFDRSGKMFGVSNALHITTDGGKAGNYRKVVMTPKTGSVTLKSGQIYQLKGKAIPISKKKKVSVHQKLRYRSSAPSIAIVDKKGRIKAMGKGKCVVYVYAQNGVHQKISLTVIK